MNPNYIDIVNWFWEEVPEMEGYKAEYATLFFALLDSINRNNWRETEVEFDRIVYKTRLDKRIYLKARRWLDDNGILLVIEGRGEYAKARFAVHSVLLGAVQKCTAKRTAKRTASAPHTAPPIYNKPLRPLKQVNNEDRKEEKILSASVENDDLIDWVEEERKEMEAAVEEMKKESLPVPGHPPFENPQITYSNLHEVLMKDKGFVDLAKYKLKLRSDDAVIDMILDYVLYFHGISRPLEPDYQKLKSHILYNAINKPKPQQKQEGNGKQYSTQQTSKPTHQDVLAIVAERYSGNSE